MAFVKEEPNEHGTTSSHHICDTCGKPFTMTPSCKDKEGWENCLADECASYDPSRDADILFMSDEEISREKPVVCLDMLRKRKIGVNSSPASGGDREA